MKRTYRSLNVDVDAYFYVTKSIGELLMLANLCEKANIICYTPLDPRLTAPSDKQYPATAPKLGSYNGYAGIKVSFAKSYYLLWTGYHFPDNVSLLELVIRLERRINGQ